MKKNRGIIGILVGVFLLCTTFSYSGYGPIKPYIYYGPPEPRPPEVKKGRGFCPIADIVSIVKATNPEVVPGTLTINETISFVQGLLNTMTWREEEVDWYSPPELVDELKEGDCEDLTGWTLWKLRKLGMPLADLGLMAWSTEPLSHIDPMVKIYGQWCVIIASGTPHTIVPAISYMAKVYEIYKKVDVSVTVCGLDKEGTCLVIIDKESFQDTVDALIEELQDRCEPQEFERPRK